MIIYRRSYVYVDKSVWKNYKAKDSNIILLRSFEEKEIRYEGEIKKEDILAFVKE